MVKPDIILINPYPYYASGINEATIEPPLGLASIAAVLEKAGFGVSIIDANVLSLRPDAVLKRVEEATTHIIGISANIVTYRASVELAHLLKTRNPRCMILLGGPHPTSLPEKALSDSSGDIVVLGEGEESMLEILQKLHSNDTCALHEIRGLVVREDGHCHRTGVRPPIDNLDKLPFPAYHLLPDLHIYRSRARYKPIAPLITSRGCPFSCIYCNCNIFGRKIRMQSSEGVLEEIDILRHSFGVRQIDILDDNFAFDQERVNQIFLGLIRRNYKLAINIQNGIRADQLNMDLIDLMKRAGVYKVSIGVESGSPKMQKVIRKNLDLDRVIAATQWLRDAGIITYANFMLGLPGDTMESMQATIDFAKMMDPHLANFMITLPLPGTELYHMIKERGRFLIPVEEGLPFGFYGNRVCYTIDQMQEDEVLRCYKRAYKEFYLRPKKIIDIMKTVTTITELRWILQASCGVVSNILRKNE